MCVKAYLRGNSLARRGPGFLQAALVALPVLAVAAAGCTGQFSAQFAGSPGGSAPPPPAVTPPPVVAPPMATPPMPAPVPVPAPAPAPSPPAPPNSMTPGPIAAGPVPEPHACNLQIHGLGLYQAVQVRLLQDGQVVANRNAPIIVGRPTVFQALLRYTGTARTGNLAGRLTLTSSAGVHTVSAGLNLTRDSQVEEPATTLNFTVPGVHVRTDTTAQIELDLGVTCPGGGRTRVPAAGPIALGAIDTGTLQVKFVPILYQADGSDRSPDVSEQQIVAFQALLQAQYPTREVKVEVGEPVLAGELEVGPDGDGWPELINGVRNLRQEEGRGTDWHYYGLISPAGSFRTYCDGACVAGLSFRPLRANAAQQVSIGVGYTGAISAETLAHELGHQHGRSHSPSPCGEITPEDVDRAFPYSDGSIGVPGFDVRNGGLVPSSRKDLMGYCNPTWISDHTYGELAKRRTEIGRLGGARLIGEVVLTSPHRSAVVSADGRLSLGHLVRPGQQPVGDAEVAQVLDRAGAVIRSIVVYRAVLEHGAGFVVDLPEPEPTWAWLQFAGEPPLALQGRPRSPLLRPLGAAEPTDPRQLP